MPEASKIALIDFEELSLLATYLLLFQCAWLDFSGPKSAGNLGPDLLAVSIWHLMWTAICGRVSGQSVAELIGSL